MLYSAKSGESENIRKPLMALMKSLGMDLVEVDLFRGKSFRKKGRDKSQSSPGSVQVRVVVYKSGSIGIEDCSRAHRAILPLLETAFAGMDLSVEVSSPGINRQIKDGVEFACYQGKGVRCWRTDMKSAESTTGTVGAAWSAGVLESADEQGITIKGKKGTIRLDYGVIAKARLDPSQEE